MVINFIGFFLLLSTHKSIFQTSALGFRAKRRNKNPHSIINFLKLYFALVFYYSIFPQILTAFLFRSSRQMSFCAAPVKSSSLKCYFWGRSLSMEIGLTKSFSAFEVAEIPRNSFQVTQRSFIVLSSLPICLMNSGRFLFVFFKMENFP